MTVEEILQSLGVTADPSKASAIQEWNTKLSQSQAEAQQKLDDAQRQVEEAQLLQRTIDDSIRQSGVNETNIAQLRANNAALQEALKARDAALSSIREQGFTGLEIPELPKFEAQNAPQTDPMKELMSTIQRGFSQMGETMNESNRYMRAFGQPIPEDPATLADRAAAAKMSVRDYVEKTYKVSDREAHVAKQAEEKKMAEMKSKWEEEYKADHPVTSGHPDGLNGGAPSNYPNIPTPRKESLREFSAKSPMEKIRDARERVSREVNSRAATA